MVNIQALIDDAKRSETVRVMRWPDGVLCPECGSAEVTRDGYDDTQPERRRDRCHGRRERFDDLTGTILAGHHQPLRVWVSCLDVMGLNLSDEQIARELGIDPDDAQAMASRLREGIVRRKPEVQLRGEVECDEVYVVAGHKGHPTAVATEGDPDGAGGRRVPLAGARWPGRSRRPSG
jgi:transposase-like protein